MQMYAHRQQTLHSRARVFSEREREREREREKGGVTQSNDDSYLCFFAGFKGHVVRDHPFEHLWGLKQT